MKSTVQSASDELDTIINMNKRHKKTGRPYRMRKGKLKGIMRRECPNGKL